MIQTYVRLWGGPTGMSDPRVSVNSDEFLTLGQERMQQIGDFALRTVKARVARGLGSDGSTMPALKVSRAAGAVVSIRGARRTVLSYAQWKVKHGLQGKRDLTGTGKNGGHMLDNLTVRSVSGSSVTMALTARIARTKALANERRAEWLGFAPEDQRAILEYAAGSFGVLVREVQGHIRSAALGRAA